MPGVLVHILHDNSDLLHERVGTNPAALLRANLNTGRTAMERSEREVGLALAAEVEARPVNDGNAIALPVQCRSGVGVVQQRCGLAQARDPPPLAGKESAQLLVHVRVQRCLAGLLARGEGRGERGEGRGSRRDVVRDEGGVCVRHCEVFVGESQLWSVSHSSTRCMISSRAHCVISSRN
jgi:hypothetical protein